MKREPPMNPRVLVWLKVAGLTLADIERKRAGDVPIVKFEGAYCPWTIHYMCWIQNRWRTWAKSVGFRDHWEALRSGHTDAEFDTWLADRGEEEIKK